MIGKRAEGLPGHFHFEHTTFNHMQLTGHYDLILSLLSLPFGQKRNLPTIIHRVAQHLTPGGIFVFNLFGPNATMARNKRFYAMNRNAITTLLNKNGLRVTFILHRQFTTRDMAGDKQFLDLYDVIAAKPKRITRCECPGPGCPDPMGVLALNTKRDSTVLAEFTRSGAFNK